VTASAITDFIQSIDRMVRAIKECISTIANIPKENKEPIYYQTKWALIRDTRLKSQVVLNKPKRLVKKVIR